VPEVWVVLPLKVTFLNDVNCYNCSELRSREGYLSDPLFHPLPTTKSPAPEKETE